ncbi:MAG: phosphoribosyl-AMP cyclohydrolase [Patescibacteria group bacterium]
MEKNNKEKSSPFYELNYAKLRGIVPASILDAKTNQYLMTGYMNAEAYRLTLDRNEVVFWSRTEKKLWLKGETSGNRLIVDNIKKGCEDDILAIYVDPLGPVCHRNTWTCFDDPLTAGITREQRFGSESKCPYCGK